IAALFLARYHEGLVAQRAGQTARVDDQADHEATGLGVQTWPVVTRRLGDAFAARQCRERFAGLIREHRACARGRLFTVFNHTDRDAASCDERGRAAVELNHAAVRGDSLAQELCELVFRAAQRLDTARPRAVQAREREGRELTAEDRRVG